MKSLCFCVFVFLSFCVFVFLSFCLFVIVIVILESGLGETNEKRWCRDHPGALSSTLLMDTRLPQPTCLSWTCQTNVAALIMFPFACFRSQDFQIFGFLDILSVTGAPEVMGVRPSLLTWLMWLWVRVLNKYYLWSGVKFRKSTLSEIFGISFWNFSLDFFLTLQGLFWVSSSMF